MYYLQKPSSPPLDKSYDKSARNRPKKEGERKTAKMRYEEKSYDGPNRSYYSKERAFSSGKKDYIIKNKKDSKTEGSLLSGLDGIFKRGEQYLERNKRHFQFTIARIENSAEDSSQKNSINSSRLAPLIRVFKFNFFMSLTLLLLGKLLKFIVCFA